MKVSASENAWIESTVIRLNEITESKAVHQQFRFLTSTAAMLIKHLATTNRRILRILVDLNTGGFTKEIRERIEKELETDDPMEV